MAQVAFSYTPIGKARKEDSGYRYAVIRLNYGNGVDTYGTGLAVSGPKLGLPNEVKSVVVAGQTNGFHYEYDQVNKVMRIFQSNASGSPLLELTAGATPAATNVYVEVVGY